MHRLTTGLKKSSKQIAKALSVKEILNFQNVNMRSLSISFQYFSKCDPVTNSFDSNTTHFDELSSIPFLRLVCYFLPFSSKIFIQVLVIF